MFYTRSNGMRVPATVVGFAPDGLLHLEYIQDAVKVVNRQCKVEHPQDNFIVYIALFWTLDNSQNTTRLNFGLLNCSCMLLEVAGFQGCYWGKHRNNWRCARAVRALCENAPDVAS